MRIIRVVKRARYATAFMLRWGLRPVAGTDTFVARAHPADMWQVGWILSEDDI